MVFIAINNEWLTRDPFREYEIKKEETTRSFLTKDEIRLLMEGKLKNAKQELYRDLYLFCAFTWHQSRHTAATTVFLSNGVPIETVSSMLGHKSIKTTQIYAKITKEKLNQDMENLAARLNQIEEFAGCTI